MDNLLNYGEKRGTCMCLGSLFMSHEINYGRCKKNIKFTELNSFHGVQ